MNFLSKCDQIRRQLWTWSHLMKTSFIFCEVSHLLLIEDIEKEKATN